jgi:adenylate kinase family enzyme
MTKVINFFGEPGSGKTTSREVREGWFYHILSKMSDQFIND